MVESNDRAGEPQYRGSGEELNHDFNAVYIASHNELTDQNIN